MRNHHFEKHLGVWMATKKSNLLYPWFNCSTTTISFCVSVVFDHANCVSNTVRRKGSNVPSPANLCENALVNLAPTTGVKARPAVDFLALLIVLPTTGYCVLATVCWVLGTVCWVLCTDSKRLDCKRPFLKIGPPPCGDPRCSLCCMHVSPSICGFTFLFSMGVDQFEPHSFLMFMLRCCFSIPSQMRGDDDNLLCHCQSSSDHHLTTCGIANVLHPKRLDHRTGDETHFFQALVVIHLHVLARHVILASLPILFVSRLSSFSPGFLHCSKKLLVLQRAQPVDVNPGTRQRDRSPPWSSGIQILPSERRHS